MIIKNIATESENAEPKGAECVVEIHIVPVTYSLGIIAFRHCIPGNWISGTPLGMPGGSSISVVSKGKIGRPPGIMGRHSFVPDCHDVFSGFLTELLYSRFKTSGQNSSYPFVFSDFLYQFQNDFRIGPRQLQAAGPAMSSQAFVDRAKGLTAPQQAAPAASRTE